MTGRSKIVNERQRVYREVYQITQIAKRRYHCTGELVVEIGSFPLKAVVKFFSFIISLQFNVNLKQICFESKLINTTITRIFKNDKGRLGRFDFYWHSFKYNKYLMKEYERSMKNNWRIHIMFPYRWNILSSRCIRMSILRSFPGFIMNIKIL